MSVIPVFRICASYVDLVLSLLEKVSHNGHTRTPEIDRYIFLYIIIFSNFVKQPTWSC